MDVSIIIPVTDTTGLEASLQGALAQRYGAGTVEVIVVAYGDQSDDVSVPIRDGVRAFAVRHSSPYVARNLGAAEACGDILLFTEAGAVCDPGWVSAHVAHLQSGATVTVGDVAPARVTYLLDLFASYERVRDAWVFSCDSWPHYFGRPKNMAITRSRFGSHGPFGEVARGADSMFVQKVAREMGCDEVVLAPDAIVRQLSIRGIPSAFADRYAHSRGLREYQSSYAAPIAFERRWRLFRETLAQYGGGPLDAASLLLLLTAGIWVYRFGGWVGTLLRSNQA